MIWPAVQLAGGFARSLDRSETYNYADTEVFKQDLVSILIKDGARKCWHFEANCSRIALQWTRLMLLLTTARVRLYLSSVGSRWQLGEAVHGE